MSIKVKQAIQDCLSKIEEENFDEDTIRTLLITSRESVRVDGLIRELAHFIAHTERTQGIFHKKVNSRYAKYKLIHDQALRSDLKNISDKIKTEEELSDFMLGGVSLEKIDAKLFNILYVDGLDDMPESHLLKYTGFKKSVVVNMIKEYYVKKGNFFYLKTIETEFLMNALRNLPTTQHDAKGDLALNESLMNAEKLVAKIKSTVDRVLKVVRGVIFFDSVFSTAEFKTEIETALLQVINKFDIDKKYLEQIKAKSDDILICIMTLLHDSKFIFYDKNEARTFLCLYIGDNGLESQKDDYDIVDDLYNNGVIGLYLEDKETLTFPLFVSDLPVKKYLQREALLKSPLRSNISKSIWTTAGRLNGKLYLI
jgi:hypothetical protein